jgi:serine/threonine protein phosphatase PrpC
VGSLIVVQKPQGLRLEWGVASHPQTPGAECGDASTIEQSPAGSLVAVIDGLGHGRDAARASQRAVETIAKFADATLEEMLRACHRALQGSRGAAISLARIDVGAPELAWIGVGNVEGVVLNPRAYQAASWVSETLLARGGVVGYDLPYLRMAQVPFGLGAVLVFATDGIRQGFSSEVQPGRRAQEIADRIMAVHDRGTDDALVLVVRQMWGGTDQES